MGNLLEELEQLKRERNEEEPFPSLPELEKWSDAVEPLLSFDRAYQREFSNAVRSAVTTHRLSFVAGSFSNMNQAIGVVSRAIKALELQQGAHQVPNVGLEHLLHPVIVEKCLELYLRGHLREAVLNSVVAVFDLIRERTGSEADGDRLIGSTMSIESPKLVLSEIDSESGRNDQKGFMQIFKGAYQGIRNPKSHTLAHDLDELKAGQYLVFASLLARRIEQASIL
jgi:uncharacterized protein (TIGR02391 family)